jgi:hypothetical protein
MPTDIPTIGVGAPDQEHIPTRSNKVQSIVHPRSADEPLLQHGTALRKPHQPDIPTTLHRAWNIATACGRVYGQQEFAIGQFQYAPFAVQAGPPQAPLPLDIRRPLCMQ